MASQKNGCKGDVVLFGVIILGYLGVKKVMIWENLQRPINELVISVSGSKIGGISILRF